jgi:ABC-type multidrug transport system fused ATPase/permease subunit
MIIDDAFSGLDVETEESVFVELFGKRGLPRRLGMTVIFATHAIHRVSYADHIIALDSTGHVLEQGSFEELKHSGGYLASLATRHKFDNGNKPQTELKSNKLSSDVMEEEATTAINSKEDERPKGELSTYKYYFASVGWSRSLISICLLLSAGTLSKSTELLLSYWTSSVTKHGNEVNDSFMGIYGLLAGLLIITFVAAVYHFFLQFVPGSAETLHARLLRAVMGAPLHFFISTDTGTTTNRSVRSDFGCKINRY